MIHKVNVPAGILQDLIWNAQLAVIGAGEMEKVVAEQTAKLQECIDEQVGDSDIVYGRKPGTSPCEVELTEPPMADVVEFGRRTDC